MKRLFDSVTMIAVWLLIVAMSFSLFLNSRTLTRIEHVTKTSRQSSRTNNTILNELRAAISQAPKAQVGAVLENIRQTACLFVANGDASAEIKEVCNHRKIKTNP